MPTDVWESSDNTSQGTSLDDFAGSFRGFSDIPSSDDSLDHIGYYLLPDTGAITLDAKTISPTSQSGHSGSRPGSTPGSVGRSPQKDYYWFAHAADTSSTELKPTAGSGDNLDQDGRESVTSLSQKDREERIRLLRERQSEERQRKLEELKLAALHAQKVREQQEDERRRKIEELRHRDQERRMLVEERKKQIWEAERERREAILRKNMEREARIEAKRNANRSSIGFAFGSSTPRLLETDPGYFGTRRAASQTNVMLTPTTPGGRSSAEREIDPSKKRASSSFGLDHKENEYHSAYEAFHWSDSNSQTILKDSLNTQPLHSSSDIVDSLLTPDKYLGVPNSYPVRDPSIERKADTQSEYLASPSTDRFAGILTGSGVFVGEDLMTKSLSSLMGPPMRGRRKTDLIPTIPSHDSPRTHSPGRAFSMTRLDALAQPRRRYLAALVEANEKRGPILEVNLSTSTSCMSKTKSMTQLAYRRTEGNASVFSPTKPIRSANANMSKSMTSLARTSPHSSGGSRSPDAETPSRSGRSLKQQRHLAQSMTHLGSALPPRPTRASQMRASALLAAKRQGMSKSMVLLHKKRIPDDSSENSFGVTRTTPSSPSRPNSSMSQQSISSHASQSSTVSMRSRTAPRRPRPFSIAGSAPEAQVDAEERQGRSTERKAAMPSSAKPPRAKSAGADRAAGELTPKQPPAAVRKMPPASAPARPSTAASSAVSRDKPKIAPKPTMRSTPKATPQPSPAVEQPPTIPAQPEKPATPKVKPPEKPENVIESPLVPSPVINLMNSDNVPSPEQPAPPPPVVVAVQEDNANQDAIVGTPPKPRINTVEEAKAAIAERRRLAREQAEREAELERQRQEELRRQEEERLRQEEEERKRWEEEQEMARRAEEDRIQRAIEEQKQREMEEQKRKEEEARMRAEKEEAERKAREEQEQMRRETEERLRKEEEERAERRKRVEAIMSRTRGKGTGTTPVTTPTKPVEPIDAKESSEKSGFPNAETKDFARNTASPVPSSEEEPVVPVSVGGEIMKPPTAPAPKPDLLGDLIPQTLEIHTVQNGGKDLYENVSVKPMELVSSLTQSLVLESDTEKQPHHTNGFAQNGLDKSMDVDIIVENNSPEKMNSSLEDFGAHQQHQRSSMAPPLPPQTEFEQLIDLGISTSTKTEDFLTNEDNVNSNITTNGPGAPFIAFEDNFTKKQESNVTDLLS